MVCQQMEEGVGPAVFDDRLRGTLVGLTPADECVLLADIAGGSPAKVSRSVLEETLAASSLLAFGGVNLPMALAAVMGIEDGLSLESLKDALVAEGTQALRAL